MLTKSFSIFTKNDSGSNLCLLKQGFLDKQGAENWLKFMSENEGKDPTGYKDDFYKRRSYYIVETINLT